MRLSKTVQKLSRAREALRMPGFDATRVDRLSDIDDFGSNPGNLRARCYLPDSLAAGAPLVVVLHGCTQTAAGYDHGSGWSGLADRHGFALLFPEQQRANNPNLCFNWFESSDTVRGRGEAASIAAMVETMVERHRVDRSRIFVTGLSAGGAMTSVMLASYPDLFAAGAIIAGLPYGCANGVAQAFACMAGDYPADPVHLAERVRAASPHRGPWPRVAVWQGAADRTVARSNADAIVGQWRELHGLPAAPTRRDRAESYPRHRWDAADGAAVIEQVIVTGMGHGTPLAPGNGGGRAGASGPHMLDVGISSTDHIAAFFGLAPPPLALAAPAATERKPRATTRPRTTTRPRKPAPKPAAASGVQQVIEDALRAAGLMR